MGEMMYDRDGFMAEPWIWSEAVAQRIAAEVGLGELNEAQWEIIRFLRGYYTDGGLPAVSHVCHIHHFEHSCIPDLFQSVKSAWRIAGLPNPGEEANAYM